MSTVWVDELTGATLLEVSSKTHGVFIVWIDAEDAERVSKHTWGVQVRKNRVYFATHVKQPSGKWPVLYLHRFLKQCPDGLQVDHHRSEYMDLRKTELRCANNQQNGYNRRSNSNTTSRFKGVSWYERTSKWIAHITHNNKLIHIGYFTGTPDGERLAARAYDAKAIEMFGEYAKLNFPLEVAA
jgi:hypothetical protein